MPRTIRFHLDENCDNGIARGLRLRGIDVTTTAEAGLIAARDEEHLAFAAREGRVVFTHDEDFLAIDAFGLPHLGIVFSRKNRRSIGQIVRFLELLWECFDSDEMIGQIEFVDP